jgi:Na+/melibiose symporter-like transporter
LVPLLIGCLFFDKNDLLQLVLFFTLMVIGANTFTASFVIPWAQLPEAIDAYLLRYKTKNDSLFYTFFILGTKVCMAIYLGLSQLVLR